VLVQRRGETHWDVELYDGAGKVGMDWYFRHTTSLTDHVMLYHLEPGAEEGEHLHEAGNPDACSPKDQDELYVVVTGEVVVFAGERRTTLSAGDAVYVPFGEPHGVRNETAQPAELVLIFGPSTSETRSS